LILIERGSDVRCCWIFASEAFEMFEADAKKLWTAYGESTNDQRGDLWYLAEQV